MAPPIRNLMDERCGSLVVVALTDQRVNRQAVWRCRCDCGGTALVISCNWIARRHKGCARCRKQRQSMAATRRYAMQDAERI